MMDGSRLVIEQMPTTGGTKRSVDAGRLSMQFAAWILDEGIEHAFHQKAVENTAAHIERTLDLPFTVPSRMVQETAGWAVPRREAGKDPEFNAHLRETAPPRTPRSKKSDRLF